MKREKIDQYYSCILQMSFELPGLIEHDQAERILHNLSNSLFFEEGQLSQNQINEALKVIRSFPTLRERVRKLMNENSLGNSPGLEFQSTPGDPIYTGEVVKGRWLICPKDGERKWDYEISTGEKRLCLKHRVYFIGEPQK